MWKSYLPQGFEALNGVLAIVCAAAFVMFARYSIIGTSNDGWRSVKAPIALTAFFLGETLIRLWVWIWRHLENANSHSTVWLFGTAGLIWMIAGVLTAMVGAFFVIRMFSPDSWPAWFWSAFVTFAIMAAIYVANYVH